MASHIPSSMIFRWLTRLVLIAALVGSFTTFLVVSTTPNPSCQLSLTPAFTDCSPDRAIVGYIHRA